MSLPSFSVEQFHLDFIQTCMQRLQVAYDNLQQFKPGEIENESMDMQLSFNIEVHIYIYTCMYIYIYIVHVYIYTCTWLYTCI